MNANGSFRPLAVIGLVWGLSVSVSAQDQDMRLIAAEICGHHVPGNKLSKLIDESKEDVERVWKEAGFKTVSCQDETKTDYVVVLNQSQGVETAIALPPVCVIKPFASNNDVLSMGVFLSGKFQISHPLAFVEHTVAARTTLVNSMVCRMPTYDELPACELRSNGRGHRYIVLYGMKVYPSYLIGVSDDRLESRLSEFKSGHICK